ncbi:MAG: spermine synthase, partial [Gammaproteobacteria bacterium]
MLAPRSWYWALLFIYTLSGMTGIAYQVLWARMLTVQFGVSIFGVVVTVAAFMLGLGLGSVLGARLSLKLRNPLLLFAVLEGGIALFALALPQLLSLLDNATSSLAVHVSLNGWYLLQGVMTLLVLVLPAVAMGMAFPLMLKVLAPTPLTLAEIYGANTCGGVAGALLPLWLLPVLGWAQAIDIVALTGFAIALSAVFLSAISPVRSAARESASVAGGRTPGATPPQGAGTDAHPDRVTLLAYAGVGAAALMLEIAWTRLFGMILLRTEYVLALILAVFLLGIGLGSLFARRMINRLWLSGLPIMAVLFSVTSLWAIPGISAWAEQGRFDSLLEALTLQGLALTALTLPVTLALGAWLPLISAGTGGLQSGSWLYGVNALGGALGALLAGVVLIPVFGAPGTLIIAASVLLLCGLVWVSGPRLKVAVAALGIAVLAVLGWPAR